MSDYSEAELRELRLIDRLVREALDKMGIEPANSESFDELIADGDLKAAECYVLSRDMVTPGWPERAGSGRNNP